MQKSTFWVFFSCGILMLNFSCQDHQELIPTNLFERVDPFIGTGGHGHTYPGPSRPFGMVQLSPDTRLDGWDGCSGYHYSDTKIYGFSHTHLSGTGVSDYGDVLLMPTVGEVFFDNGANGGKGYASNFSKENEKAHAGYYEVTLNDHPIKVELTSTERVGFHRYHFPTTKAANVIIDLVHRDEVLDSQLKQVSKTELEGYRYSKAWAQNQKIHFVIQFSQPFKKWGIIDKDQLVKQNEQQGKYVKGFFQFETKEEEPLLVKVGISPVSIEGARKNLNQEISEWDFDQIKKESELAWEKQLSKIQIEEMDLDKQKIFYTAMYHSFLNPNLFSDVDGQFRAMNDSIYQSSDHEQYTIFSLWDTYRATHPLFTILEQKRTIDFIKTFLNQYETGGSLPIWELAGNYTGCMIGYHAIPVIADAYVKGIRQFDKEKALEAMMHSSNQDHLGLSSYKRLGFVAADEEPESVSKTLEYAYDDFCIAQMAKGMGKNKIAKTYKTRSQNYIHVFDPSTKFMRARVDHQWFSPFLPEEVNFHYTEANSWQYSFYVPQDIIGFRNLLGGQDSLEKRLDDLFAADSKTTGREQADITGLIGQYAHGNEPSHHIAYLYNYTRHPHKTQKITRQILEELYTAKPDGLSGNEDCGQMSSWYVFSALGFYPVTPGSTQYELTSPLFDQAKIKLENGNELIIKVNRKNKSDQYIQQVFLNGKLHGKHTIEHFQIMSGGELVFELGPEPKDEWFLIRPNQPAYPGNYFTSNNMGSTPIFDQGDIVFKDSTQIHISTLSGDVYYTKDGTAPQIKTAKKFNQSFMIYETQTIRARSFVENGTPSPEVSLTFRKIPQNWSIQLASTYANQYNGGGDNALIDYRRAGKDFRTGGWQGFEGQDLEAVIHFGEKKSIQSLALSCLQDQNSWIFMPLEVQYFSSNDGKEFSLIGTVKNTIEDKADGSIKHEFLLKKKITTPYLKVKAISRKTNPEWHKGAGGKCWVFADELIIN